MKRHRTVILQFVAWTMVLTTLVPRAEGQQRTCAVNPPAMFKPTGFSHVIVAADQRSVYVSGQVPLDSTGKLVGPGDFRIQATKVFDNIRAGLTSVGARFSDVVKVTSYLTDLANIPTLREVRRQYFDSLAPPASTFALVPAIGTGILLEIEATAVVAEPIRCPSGTRQ